MAESPSPRALDSLALGYHLAGEHEKAVETLEQAVALLPQGPSPLRDTLEERLERYRAEARGDRTPRPRS